MINKCGDSAAVVEDELIEVVVLVTNEYRSHIWCSISVNLLTDT